MRRLLGNLTIGTKILAGIGLMAVIAVLVGVVGIKGMSTMNAATKDLYTMGLEPLVEVQQIAVTMQQTRTDVLNNAISVDAAARTRFDQALVADDAEFARLLDSYAAKTVAPDRVAELRSTWTEYRTVRT